MINKNRIVPVMATDLLSLYGLILKMDSDNSSMVAVNATNPGEFTVASGAGSVLIANEPVKSLNFASGYTAGTVYFVAALDYEGFAVNGTAVTPTGGVDADGCTLYKAVLATGAVTITKIGF